MTSLTDAVRRFRAGRDAVPPFFAGATEGPLAVGREIFENPRTLTLPDGRDLGYAVAGDPAGDPGLVFHGWPNCRTFAAAFDEIGSERGLRIVAPERPGFGVSDPDPGRQLTDWPADVTALMDHLGIDEAPVLGISGGGPYALSCAHEVPGRTPRAAVGCGVGPMRAVSPAERGPFTVARYAPRVIQSYLRAEEVAARYAPERLLERRAATAADYDADYWRGEVGQLLVATAVAARQGHGNEHLVRDLHLYATEWGFDLGDIDIPVGLWYGRRDRLVPVSAGRYLERHIPTAEAHFYPEYGHISVVEENEPAMVDWLRRSHRP
jgi:pimeloyl-ACP methyl ester carboxylesterase